MEKKLSKFLACLLAAIQLISIIPLTTMAVSPGATTSTFTDGFFQEDFSNDLTDKKWIYSQSDIDFLVKNGNLQIDNHGENTANYSPLLANTGEMSEYTAEFKYTASSTGLQVLVNCPDDFKAGLKNKYYMLFFRGDGVHLYRATDTGGWSEEMGVKKLLTYSFQSNQTYSIRLIVTGSKFEVGVKSDSDASYVVGKYSDTTDGAFDGGLFGFKCYGNSDIDNLVIYPGYTFADTFEGTGLDTEKWIYSNTTGVTVSKNTLDFSLDSSKLLLAKTDPAATKYTVDFEYVRSNAIQIVYNCPEDYGARKYYMLNFVNTGVTLYRGGYNPGWDFTSKELLTYNWETGATYQVRLIVDGSTITVGVKKASETEYTAATYTDTDSSVNEPILGGRFGFRYGSARVNWVRIKPPTQAVSAIPLAGETGTKGSPLLVDTGIPQSYPAVQGSTVKERLESALNEFEARGTKDEMNLIAPHPITGAITYYVAANGDDVNGTGTKENPVQTLNRALSGVSALSQEQKEGGVVIYMRGGTYSFDKTVQLKAQHSGSADAPLIISAYPGEEVVFSAGGTAIEGKDFTQVTSNSKLSADLLDKVYHTNLSQYNLSFDLNESPSKYSLFVDGAEMTIARYPNTGKEKLGDVLDRGHTYLLSRFGPAGLLSMDEENGGTEKGALFEPVDSNFLTWENTGDIWMFGSFCYDWRTDHAKIKTIDKTEKTIRTTDGISYGVGNDYAGTGYYYYNVLEELDVPGEWYLDRTTGDLFVYPYEEINDNSTIILSSGTVDAISVSKASNIILNGITFENMGGNAITASKVDHFVVQNCKVSQAGHNGIFLNGTNSGIINSDICNTGWEGIVVSGGDRGAMTSSNNFVQNNSIYNTSKIDSNLAGLKIIDSVGLVASHNLIQFIPGVATMISSSNECVFEYNEVCGTETTFYDSGAVYVNTNPTMRGIHIRNNYIHDLGLKSTRYNPVGIYFDDRASYSYAYNNIIEDAPLGMLVNDGWENLFENNLIFKGTEYSKCAILFAGNLKDKSIHYKDAFLKESGKVNKEVPMLENSVGYNTRYPDFAGYVADIKAAREDAEKTDYADVSAEIHTRLADPKGNYIANNIFVDHCTINLNGGGMDKTYADGTPKNVVRDNTSYTSADLRDTGTAYVVGGKTFSYENAGLTRTLSPEIGTVSGIMPVSTEKTPTKETYFSWTPSVGADYYCIVVSDQVDFSNPVIDDTALDNQYIVNDVLENASTYYWKIEAVTTAQSRGKKMASSSIKSFETMTASDEGGETVLGQLTQLITTAQQQLQGIIDGTNPGEYHDGTAVKAALSSAIQAAQSVAAQQLKKVEYKNAIELLQAAVDAAKVGANDGVVTLDMDSEKYKNTSNAICNLTHTEADGIELNAPAENVVEIVAQNVKNYESLVLDYKIAGTDTTGFGWHGFGYRDASETNATTPHYAVIISKDALEIQKYLNGLNVVASVENKKESGGRIIDRNQWYRLELSMKNTGEGVRIRFYVDGNLVLETLEEEPVTLDGGNVVIYTSRASASGSMYLRAVPTAELVSNDMTVYHALTVNNGTGCGNYEANASVSVQADAAPTGKQFSHWESSVSGVLADASAEVTTVTVPDSDVTITAVYEVLPQQPGIVTGQQLTISSAGSQGEGTALQNGETYIKGGQLFFVAENSLIKEGMASGLYYLPVSWNVNPTGSWNPKTPGEVYSASFSTAEMTTGAHTLTVTYALTAYDTKTGWGTPDLTKTQTKTIQFTLTESGTTSGAGTQNGDANVPTGGSSQRVLWLMAFATAWIGCLTCAVIRRRKLCWNHQK